MQQEDVRMGEQKLASSERKRLKKALRTLHTLELMAINIYKFQIAKRVGELNRQLIAAMCNEMTHYQDFQVKLYEHRFRPCIYRWAYWIVGFVFGFFSRLLGKKTILKTGIWVEAKAVAHYDEILNLVHWDQHTRNIIEKNQADEYGHIDRWKKLLKNIK